jgi:hypothetical protein
MIEQFKIVDIIVITTAVLSMLAVFTALLVTAFIFYRSKQDIAEVEELKRNIKIIESKIDESGYISDQIGNVLYDLYDLFAAMKAYIELREVGYRVDGKLFDGLNRRVLLIEKHFGELGLFSVDEERRKSVQSSLANRYGDADTVKIMQKIADGKIGIKDKNIRSAIRTLEGRLKSNMLFVDSSSWTGRPSGGSF